jgi:hypothetical protein
MSLFRRVVDAVLTPFRALFQLPVKLLSAPRKMAGLSLPARVAMVSFVLLCLAVLAMVLAFRGAGSEEGRRLASFSEYLGGWRGAAVLLIVAATPFFVYKAVQYWLEGEPPAFADIDDAWRAGMRALRQERLDIAEIPLFVVLGLRDEQQVMSLFAASGVGFRVRHVPDGPAALHWYANQDAIFIACTSVGYLSRVTRDDATLGTDRTSDAGHGDHDQSPAVGRGTMLIEPGEKRPIAPPMTAPTTGDAYRRGDLGGTILIDRRTVDVAQLIAQEPRKRDDAGRAGRQAAAHGRARRDAVEETRRLEDLCHRIKIARQPRCPINGLMTLLSFECVRNRQCNLQLAARRDIETIQRQLELRFPVIPLVTEMQSEAGFFELVRRVGPDVARQSRFGKGVKGDGIWSIPTRDYVEAVAYQACGAFEDFAYDLFRKRGGLTERGNSKLYSLLCHFRGEARGRLTQILGDAFSQEGESRESLAPLLFCGCYFAATGDTADQQSFVQGVFERFLHERSGASDGGYLFEELGWADSIRNRERNFQRLVLVMQGVAAALVVAMAVMLVFRFI